MSMTTKAKTNTKPKPGNKPKAGLNSKTKYPPAKKPKGKLETLIGLYEDQERKSAIAAKMLSPQAAAAVASRGYLRSFGEPDVAALMGVLGESMTRVHDGNLKDAEFMLMGQAQALQSIFMHLADRSAHIESLKQYELDLRLALKAQAQCCRTLEVLAGIKNPPIILARQANVTSGPQQINNGVTAQQTTGLACEKAKIIQNELMDMQP